MTILAGGKIKRVFTLGGPGVVIQANSHSAAWPLYSGDVTGPSAALPTPNSAGIYVAHNSGCPVIFRFGTDATAKVHPNLAGWHRIEAGTSMLLDEGESDAVAATWVAVMAPGGSAKLTFMLATSKKVIEFESPADTLDYFDAVNTSGGLPFTGFFSPSFTTAGTIFDGGTLSTTGFPT